MFCKNCGAQIPENASFCAGCGTPISMPTYQPQTGFPPVGFSPRINDPAFASYKRKSVAWSIIFSSILFVLAVVGMPIYGKASGEIDWPKSLFYGLGVGGMFVVIALLQTLKKSLDKTWDGVVVFKDSYKVRERVKGYTHYHVYYIIKIQKETGGTKKHKWRDTVSLYNYYNVGDRVRHHKGFSYYEKYDKSGDTHIMCAACMAFQPKENEICSRCKCPLLK